MPVPFPSRRLRAQPFIQELNMPDPNLKRGPARLLPALAGLLFVAAYVPGQAAAGEWWRFAD